MPEKRDETILPPSPSAGNYSFDDYFKAPSEVPGLEEATGLECPSNSVVARTRTEHKRLSLDILQKETNFCTVMVREREEIFI